MPDLSHSGARLVEAVKEAIPRANTGIEDGKWTVRMPFDAWAKMRTAGIAVVARFRTSPAEVTLS